MWQLFGLICILFLLVALINKVKKTAERKKERAERERRLQFALPEKNEEFIRARLDSVLNERVRKSDTEVRALSKEYSFSYIKKLIALLKEKRTSSADKIQIEEYAHLIGVYAVKEKWTGDDLGVVNEAFARVIKLSGKYAV